MKHYYRIGEISRLYGVGPDSLRYYEELGILKPHRGEIITGCTTSMTCGG